MNDYQYNRNYGCRCKEVTERGFRFLIVENEKIRVSINLDKGAEIFEFLYKPTDLDFLWRSPNVVDLRYRNLFLSETGEVNFLNLYEGGWQDILPNIGSSTEYLGAHFGIHGEIYKSSWRYEIILDESEKVIISLKTRLNKAPFFIVKKIIIKSECSYMEIEESVKNESKCNYKFMWGQHPCLGKPFLNENCRISVPLHKKAITNKLDISDTNKILPLNKEFKWPFIKGRSGEKLNLAKVFHHEAKTAFIFRLEDLEEGWYGVTDLKKGIGFGMIWDKNIYKNLWFWAVYKGCNYYPWYGKTYNLAIEPWSSRVDDFNEALITDDFIEIKPDEVIVSKYSAIIYESKKAIKGFDENYIPL